METLDILIAMRAFLNTELRNLKSVKGAKLDKKRIKECEAMLLENKRIINEIKEGA